MVETIVEKAACENCGADAREGTTFCYNCGKSVEERSAISDQQSAVGDQQSAASDPQSAVSDQQSAVSDRESAVSNGSEAAVSDETKAALDDLAARLKIDEATDEDRRASAAAERKRARVKARRNEIVWEPVEGPGILFIAATVFICILTLVVVLVALRWK
jgi:uncharacterized Zn finger protein (UPF0148 family)